MGINIIIPIVAFGSIPLSHADWSDTSCGWKPDACQKDLDWALNEGWKEEFNDWYPNFETITGASRIWCGQGRYGTQCQGTHNEEDMLLYWYCQPWLQPGNCRGLERPCGRTCGYPSIGWNDVWYGGEAGLVWWRSCYDRCQKEHPKSPTWPGDEWKYGHFTCDRYKTSWSGKWCICYECQRDCHLTDIRAVDKCHFADIPAIKNDVSGKMGYAIYDTIASVVSTGIMTANPAVGIVIGETMKFGRLMFGAFENENELLDDVIDEIEDRFERMKECMFQEINKYKAEDHLDEMSGAFALYGVAADEMVHEDKEPEDIRNKVETAWTQFHLVIAKKFKKYDTTSEVEFKKLLLPTQDYVSLYALVSAAHLAHLLEENNNSFKDTVGYVVDDFNALKEWTSKARDEIMDGMDWGIRALPCRNDEEIVREMEAYKVQFEKHNIQPIEEIIVNFEAMKTQTEKFLSDPTAAKCSGSELVKVTWVGHHPHGDDAIYFHFDLDEMKAALEMSSSDWFGKTFLMYNARSKMVADVKLFWNYGTLAEGESTSDFRVGDQLAFNIEDEHCDDLELEFCLPIASKMFDPVWLCSNMN